MRTVEEIDKDIKDVEKIITRAMLARKSYGDWTEELRSLTIERREATGV